MQAKDIIKGIEELTPLTSKTCDTFKSGDCKKEVNKVVVSMFATIETIKSATAKGAQMLIVHEPTYYHHYEEDIGSNIAKKKKQLIEESGLIIYRYHDRPHDFNRDSDMIIDGGVKALGLQGTLSRYPSPAIFRYTPDTPITAKQMVKRIEEKMGLNFVRLAGETNYPTVNIALCFGTPPGIGQVIEDESIDMILTGEICEWENAERIRDAYQLGMHKSLIVMTHEGSEREGMKLFAQRFQNMYPDIQTEYYECGEVFQKL